MDTEIGGDLLDRHAVVAVAGHAYDVVAKLAGIRPGHKDIPPARPSGQANSDVTYPCSRPVQSLCGLQTSRPSPYALDAQRQQQE